MLAVLLFSVNCITKEDKERQAKEAKEWEAKEALAYAKKYGNSCPCAKIVKKTDLNVSDYLSHLQKTGKHKKDFNSGVTYYACDTWAIIVYNSNINKFVGCLPPNVKVAKKYRRVADSDWTTL